MNDDLEVPLTNREKKRKPTTGKTYCGCDAYILHVGETCPKCGIMLDPRKARKRDIKIYDTN